MKYDSTQDVKNHSKLVERMLSWFTRQLLIRGAMHDRSKLGATEKRTFDRWVPELRRLQFGSDAYKDALKAMGKGLRHHYKENRHHPEYFATGVSGMNLIDVVEMVMDWKASSDAKNQPVNLDILQERFGLSDQLVAIINNTYECMK